MKLLAIIVVLMLTACGERKPALSYDQLVNYPKSCAKKTAQLAELTRSQEIKHFAQDPDELNEEDRMYNSKLKSTIWWYTLKCDNEKLLASYDSDQ